GLIDLGRIDRAAQIGRVEKGGDVRVGKEVGWAGLRPPPPPRGQEPYAVFDDRAPHDAVEVVDLSHRVDRAQALRLQLGRQIVALQLVASPADEDGPAHYVAAVLGNHV